MVLAILTISVLATMAVPTVFGTVLPTSSYGNVTVNGAPALVNTIITGEIVGTLGSPGNGSITVTEAGKYGGPGAFDLKLFIQTNNEYDGGKTIKFYMKRPSYTGEIEAAETATFDSDVHQLDLTLTTGAAPNITSYAPETSVNDTESATRAFNITVNQTVNVRWQINGTEVQTNGSVTEASYTKESAIEGYWNVSAIVENVNGTDMHTWNVTPPPDLVITEKWLCWPDNCTICYNVTNTGNGTAPKGHNTTLFVDGVERAYAYVPVPLAPNESYIGCFNGYNWPYTPAEDNITVCADNNNTIAESNETNNCMINTWMCGNVNEDHEVNVLDVLGVYRRALDPNYPLELPWAGDVDCDGNMNVVDVLHVYRRALDPSYVLNCCCTV